MFEHLDDPEAFVASEELRASVVAAGGRVRRRRRRRLVAGGSLACLGLLLAGGLAYVERRDAAVDRVEVAVQPSTDGAVNVLLVGDDGDLAGADGARVDAAVLLRLDDGGARMLSIPRDLHAPEVGQRFSVLAGPDLQASVDAVHAVVGDVPIDHVVRVGFQGFVALVDAVGGVPIRVERFVVDEPTGVELEPSEACQLLDGEAALGLARARQVAGDPTGDLGRTARQRVLLQAALGAVGTSDLDALSRVVADHAVVDDGLTLGRMVDLGRRLAAAGSITADVLPLAPTRLAGGGQVLQLAPGATEVLARYGLDPAGTPPPTAAVPTTPTDGTVADPHDPGIVAC